MIFINIFFQQSAENKMECIFAVIVLIQQKIPVISDDICTHIVVGVHLSVQYVTRNMDEKTL